MLFRALRFLASLQPKFSNHRIKNRHQEKRNHGYRHAAERILERHSGGLVPQLIGPKLLAMLHNLLDFPVIETAGVLSPEVARDIVEGRADPYSSAESLVRSLMAADD